MEAAVSAHPSATRDAAGAFSYAPPDSRPRRASLAPPVRTALHLVTPIDEEFHRRRRISAEFYVPRERSEAVARVANAVIAGLSLVALTPLLVLIAVMVRITSRGPIFYSQMRVGLDRRWSDISTDSRRRSDLGGRPFKMWKFRTMRVDAEKDGKAVWATRNDPRVTPIGGFLRLTRLDELPQLWNVLRGDMNIVGPRPERPTLFDELRNTIPEYPIRQRVKPGITGWAQINQEYDSSLADVVNKVRLDLEYITRQSMLEDLRIMSMTIPVMIMRKGAH